MFCNITLFCRTDRLSSIHLKSYLDYKNIVKLGQMLAVKGNSSSKPDFPNKSTNIYYLQYRFGARKIKYKFLSHTS